MRRIRQRVCAIIMFVCLGAGTTAGAADVIRHRFLCVDNGANHLLFVDQAHPEKSWTVNIPPGSRDLQLLGGERVLVSHGNGAREYDLATGKALSWQVARYRRIQSARRLDSGNTLLITVNGVVYEIDREGKEVGKTVIGLKGIDLRLVRLLDDGSLLIGAKRPQAVVIADRAGKILNRLPLPGSGYKAIRLPDGRILAGAGQAVKVITFSPGGEIVSWVGGKAEHPGLGLDFCSGWDLLPNGHIVMANWLGHGKQGTGAHLVEFTEQNEVVWQWADHAAARQVTNVRMLPDDRAVTKGAGSRNGIRK